MFGLRTTAGGPTWVRAAVAVCLLLLTPSVGLAQTGDDGMPVQGEVLDAQSGRPLDGALVVLHDLWQFTRTDQLGYFRFEDVPPGEHEFAVYALGYRTVETLVGFDDPDDVFAVNLDPAPVEIEGLHVDLLSDEEIEYRSFGQRYDYVGPELMTEYREKYAVITEMLRARFPAAWVMDGGGLMTGGLCVQMTRVSSSPSEATGHQCAVMFIDGMQAEPQDVGALHPEEIGSIRFLDRLEARLVYGDLGRYGVLLIETRTGIN